MSTSGVWPPEQQYYPQQYQYYYPATYHNPFAPPRRNKPNVIVAVIVAVVVAAVVVPTVLFSFAFRPQYDTYNDDYRYYGTMTFESDVEVEGPTKAKVQLYRFSRDPAATEFELILTRDGSAQGVYHFPSDSDCTLTLVSGQNLGVLFYEDSNRNFELDPGDEISMTGLSPSSFYHFEIIYMPTGEVSTENSFRMPSR